MSLLKDHRPCLCHIGWTEAAVTHARKGHAVDILPQCRIGSEADVNPIIGGGLSTIFGIHASKIIKRQLFSRQLFSRSRVPLTFKAPETATKKHEKRKNDLSPTKTRQGDLFSRRNQVSRPCIVSPGQMAIRPSIIKFAIKSPHLLLVQQQLNQCPQAEDSFHAQRPKKTTLTKVTWELVQHKRQWRKNLADCEGLRKNLLLNVIFLSWWASRGGGMNIASLHEVDKCLSDLDVKIAQAYFQFRSLVAKVVQKTCRDDAAFFEGLAQESSHRLEPKHAKKFWSTLRRHMPKFRDRKRLAYI